MYKYWYVALYNSVSSHEVVLLEYIVFIVHFVKEPRTNSDNLFLFVSLLHCTNLHCGSYLLFSNFGRFYVHSIFSCIVNHICYF